MIEDRVAAVRERIARAAERAARRPGDVVFEVALRATKVEIKQAGERLLGAKVAHVRTSIAHGKVKRQGRFAGQRPDWKKAYVRLRAGEKVPDFLEGA